MQTEIERPRVRVRMRMPNLGPQATPQTPNASKTDAAPWPDLPLSPEAPVQQPGDVARIQADADAASDFFHRHRSSLMALGGLIVVTGAVAALGNRHRNDPSPVVPFTAQLDPQLDAKPATLVAKQGRVKGGSPSELTSIPELSLPGGSRAGSVANQTGSGSVERLPPVPPECQAPVAFDLSSQTPAGGGTEGTVPGMARLERRIETPTSEVPYDATRQSLY